MTRPSTSNNTDLALDRSVLILEHPGIAGWGNQILVTLYKSFQHVLNNKIRIIDNSLHGVFLCVVEIL
jgi:hypothetical protein